MLLVCSLSSVARVLIRDPEVVFLDEPCANLDGRATREIEAILKTAQSQGTRIVMATHDIGQAKRLADDAGLRAGQAMQRGQWDETFTSLFSRIESGFSHDPVSPFLAVALGWEALATVTEGSHGTAATETLVGRAQFDMQQNYHQGLQVEDLARGLGVSRATLFRKFRNELGQSPKAYLDDIRLTQARELLRKGNSAVKEVAYACGFHCSHYFSRTYRSRFGESPSSTRET